MADGRSDAERGAAEGRVDLGDQLFEGVFLGAEGAGEITAKEAERLLADSGWLPEPLRLIDHDEPTTSDTSEGEAETALPAFLAGEDEDEETAEDPEAEAPAMIAAE